MKLAILKKEILVLIYKRANKEIKAGTASTKTTKITGIENIRKIFWI